MGKPEELDNLHFDIDSSVIFQLGERLISDVSQALLELVKNAYDADSDYANVIVNTSASLGEINSHSRYPEARGFITIEDNGDGMTLDVIRDGWLTISNSFKREFKAQKKTTSRGRTPMGDKGLGRLGAQRLGYNLEIFTKPKNSESDYHVAFSWKDFRPHIPLSEIAVRVIENPGVRSRPGTLLIVSDLREEEQWKSHAISELQDELSKMLSPYKDARDFRISASIDGRKLELAELTDQVRQAATIRYDIRFDGDEFSILGRARLSYFGSEEDSLTLESLLKDNGEAFLEFLSRLPRFSAFNITRSQEEDWFLEFRASQRFSEMDRMRLADGVRANPGPFRGEIDYFLLTQEAQAKQDVFGKLGEYRAYIKRLSGIRIYRNGFAVRVEDDWLKLGGQQTSGSSFYGLRPSNTLGFIALDSKENLVLEEKTDREGFQVTPYYENFYELTRKIVDFSSSVQEFLRRGWNQYKEEARLSSKIPATELKSENLTRDLKTKVSKAQTFKGPLNTIKRDLEAEQTANPKVPGYGPSREAVKEAVKGIEEYLDEISELEAVAAVLHSRIEELKRQIEDTYETMSLGLTAEALSHEISNISDQIARRTQDIASYMKAKGISDVRINSYVEAVRATVSSLRKQLAHLSPSMRYVREKREKFSLPSFLLEMRDFYEDRLSRSNIVLDIENDSESQFIVNINKGKLSQIIDNMILNSEYWLKEDMRTNVILEGKIRIVCRSPFVFVSDNGRGIEKSVQGSLFEPFVTAKGKGEGRGLGLFIVKQLLETEGCSIRLQPDKNNFDRLFNFELNLAGVTNAAR